MLDMAFYVIRIWNTIKSGSVVVLVYVVWVVDVVVSVVECAFVLVLVLYNVI